MMRRIRLPLHPPSAPAKGETEAHPNLPPPFAPNPVDPYLKASPGQAISYLFHEDQETQSRTYRTGILVSKDGRVRFYEGGGGTANGERQTFQDFKFHLNQQLFRSGHFRVRTDLVVGAFCYDHEQQVACQLKEMDATSGAMRVELLETSTTTTASSSTHRDASYWISPDYLVGNYQPLPSPSAQPCKRMKASKTKSTDPPRIREFVGVYAPTESQFDFQWYIRGKLAQDVDAQEPPYLVQGEAIRHAQGRVLDVQVLEFDSRKHMYVQVIGQKQKRQLQALVQQAERNHTDGIRAQQQQGLRSERPTSLQLRPLQPVLCKNMLAKISEVPDSDGWVKVIYTSHKKQQNKKKNVEVTERYSSVRLVGHNILPLDLPAFSRSKALDLPRQRTSYKAAPDFLLQEWRKANGTDSLWRHFQESFDTRVEERNRIRVLAASPPPAAMVAGTMDAQVVTNEVDGRCLTVIMATRLEDRARVLLQRLQSDFQLPRSESLMTLADFKSRIVELKKIHIHPNMLLLCGGFAPEVTAYKRLGAASLGTVILQDTDLHAVGVAVAAHPDVEFAIVAQKDSKKRTPGDIRILRQQELIREVEIKVGGIHTVAITNPCQSFSLAGKKDGFKSENGQLLHDCFAILRGFETSSDMPVYLAENVPSTKDTNESFNAYLPDRGTKYFVACGSMCSPSIRRRKFATNRPPPDFSKVANGPTLDGDLPHTLAASVLDPKGNRMVHPDLKKFPCMVHSNKSSIEMVWEKRGEFDEPVQQVLTPQEAELAMGYKPEEVGVTAKSAKVAILKRIADHDFDRDGCLISLKGCADDKDLLEDVDDARRLEMLGNSQVVSLLEALMWRERELFPAVQPVQ